MDLKQLEYFVRVAELGSFTKASSVLEIAQPALSRQIRLLETELRQNLLIRNGRGVVTTDAGKLLLEHGRGILHQVVRAKEDLDRVRGSISGRVAVGLPPSMAKILTVSLTREFRKRLPEAALSISEGLSMTIQEWLQTGRVDIALLYNPSYTPDIETSELLEEELYLISPINKDRQDGAIELKDLAKHPLIMPARPNALRMLVETQLSKVNRKPQIVLEIDGVSAILDLVKEGLGCAVLPKYSVYQTGKTTQFNVQRINGLVSRLVMAVAAHRPTTSTQQAMLSLIRELTVRSIQAAAMPE